MLKRTTALEYKLHRRDITKDDFIAFIQVWYELLCIWFTCSDLIAIFNTGFKMLKIIKKYNVICACMILLAIRISISCKCVVSHVGRLNCIICSINYNISDVFSV